jgi:hypothetical protein
VCFSKVFQWFLLGFYRFGNDAGVEMSALSCPNVCYYFLFFSGFWRIPKNVLSKLAKNVEDGFQILESDERLTKKGNCISIRFNEKMIRSFIKNRIKC